MTNSYNGIVFGTVDLRIMYWRVSEPKPEHVPILPEEHGRSLRAAVSRALRRARRRRHALIPRSAG